MAVRRALRGDVGHGADDKRAVGLGDVGDLWELGGHCVGGPPVGVEIGVSPKPAVMHSRDVRHTGQGGGGSTAAQWLPGEQILTVREIAAEHDVSVTTARKALNVLAMAGLVTATPGLRVFRSES